MLLLESEVTWFFVVPHTEFEMLTYCFCDVCMHRDTCGEWLDSVQVPMDKLVIQFFCLSLKSPFPASTKIWLGSNTQVQSSLWDTPADSEVFFIWMITEFIGYAKSFSTWLHFLLCISITFFIRTILSSTVNGRQFWIRDRDLCLSVSHCSCI